MRTFALASLLLTSLPAAAGVPLDKFDARAGSVSVTGVSEVPLYRIREDDRLLVRAKVSADREATFLLTLADTQVTISEDLAKELKLKVKSGNKKLVNLKGEDNKFREGGEIKQTTVPSFELGGLKITDLTVTVVAKGADINGYAIDGTLPLSVFPSQVAFAAVTSKGVLRVGPAVEGANLVSAVGGQALPYTSVAREKFKNKVRGYKVKGTTDPYPVIVEAAVGGQPVKVVLGRAGMDCDVTPKLDFGQVPTRKVGDRTYAWLGTTLAGVEVAPQWYLLNGGYDLQLGPQEPVQGQICGEVLNGFDLAIDPVARKVGLAKPGADGRSDLEPTLYAALVAASEKPPAPPPADDKKKAAGPVKPSPAPWKALYKAQTTRGDWEGAAASARKIVEIDDKDCSAHLRLGSALGEGGRYSDALVSFQRAAELYHAWWDLPVDEREKISKKLKKAKTDEEKAAVGHTEQPAVCYTAEGSEALAYMAMGDLVNVQRLYVERLDLDPLVALVAGNAALAQGKTGEAASAYRQAIKRETVGAPLGAARVGLGLANRADWTAAAPAFEEALELGERDLLSVRTWLDGLRRSQGQDAALAAARALSNSNPGSLPAAVSFYREAQISGDAAAISAAERRVDEAAARRERGASAGSRDAVLSYYRLLRRENDAARALAESALKGSSFNPIAFVVLAELAAAEGQTSKANEYLKQAASRGAGSPAYALITGELR